MYNDFYLYISTKHTLCKHPGVIPMQQPTTGRTIVHTKHHQTLTVGTVDQAHQGGTWWHVIVLAFDCRIGARRACPSGRGGGHQRWRHHRRAATRATLQRTWQQRKQGVRTIAAVLLARRWRRGPCSAAGQETDELDGLCVPASCDLDGEHAEMPCPVLAHGERRMAACLSWTASHTNHWASPCICSTVGLFRPCTCAPIPPRAACQCTRVSMRSLSADVDLGGSGCRDRGAIRSFVVPALHMSRCPHCAGHIC